jgi:hypothetical protein
MSMSVLGRAPYCARITPTTELMLSNREWYYLHQFNLLGAASGANLGA